MTLEDKTDKIDRPDMPESTNDIYRIVTEEADALSDQLIAIRRDLHAHPELGWMEMRTSALIAQKLTEYGCDRVLTGDQVCDAGSRMGLPSEEDLEVHFKEVQSQDSLLWGHAGDLINTSVPAQNGDLINAHHPDFLSATRGGMTGVIGILHCGEGPVIGMRFDIDALPILETDTPSHYPAECGFCSVNPGVMHACGHDGHTAIGLGTAKLLCHLRRVHPESFHGTIKFIFQPAEEGVRGAKAIVAAGHLDDVDYLLGAHMGGDPNVTANTIGIGDGASLATTKIDVIYHGKAAHAGVEPDAGNNAMLAMAAALLNLQAIPRYGKAATRINVGKVTAGAGRNIICDTAKMELEVRGMTSDANEYMEHYAYRIIKAAAEMHNCTYETRLMGAAKCGRNDRPLCNLIADLCEHELNLPVAWLPPATVGGSEDYSYMSERVQSHGGQSCYFYNLSALPAPIHNEHFDFRETALPTGVKVFAAAALNLMGHSME